VILNALARAQTRLGRRTTLHVVNPKSISVSELYGVLDKDTRDWTDGLLSNIFRWVAGGTLPCCLVSTYSNRVVPSLRRPGRLWLHVCDLV
jgi:hypothetical protein